MSRNVKNWKLPVYEMNEVESSNPAGNSFQELKEMELEDYTGAGTANTHCNCYSEDASCGRLCTGTAECPIMTIICCKSNRDALKPKASLFYLRTV